MEASVVVPTWNKAAYLELTLASLLHQSFDRSRYEVIVVDDGSSDATNTILEYFAAQAWNFRAISQANAGRSAARNAGVRAARGKITIFIDDDCLCDHHLVAAHVACHAGASNKAVMGLCSSMITRIPLNREQYRQDLKEIVGHDHPVPEHPFVLQAIENALAALPDAFNLISIEDISQKPEKVRALSIPNSNPNDYYAFEHIATVRHSCPWNWFITRNASVDTDALLRVGLFDEDFQGWGGEDIELGYRLCRAGIQFDATLDAVIYHQAHPRNTQAARQEWVRNYVKFCKKYNEPEVYLMWQIFEQIISLHEYEQLIVQLRAGRLSVAEIDAIKKRYDEYIAGSLQTDLETV
jgi:glycosyltransferase involved in cell wall biosynthesis